MINTLKQSFKIDMAISINSVIYLLSNTPLLKGVLPENLYKSKGLKIIASIISLLFGLIKAVITKGIYIFIVYKLSLFISEDSLSFITLFTFLTMLGAFINHKITTSSKKKYYSIVLMNMDAKKYTLAYLFINEIMEFVSNSILLAITCYFIELPLIYGFLLSIFIVIVKPIGEAYNIWYFEKFKYLAMNNYKHYFTLVVFFLGLGIFLPYVNIFFNQVILLWLIIITFIIFLITMKYILSYKNYPYMYKKLNNRTISSNESEKLAYTRQMMVEVKDKDKKIDPKKLKNKKGYSLFNTIFFERHKYLLLSSALKYAAVLTGLFIITGILVLVDPVIKEEIGKFLILNFSFIVLVMYFINRGAVVTQAMFFNCDHAMLRFNFYRDRGVILNLFKERLKTLIKINLIPSVVMSIGIVVLFYMTGVNINILEGLAIILSVNAISVFFSVHYLVLYYLLQPYNQDLKMKSLSYGIITTLTYIIAYSTKDINTSFLMFSIITVVVTTLYIIIAINLVLNKADVTFRIR